MKEYQVMASSFDSGPYSAGRFVANSEQEAIDQARESYRNSGLGRQLDDCGKYRFWIKSKRGL